MNLNFVLGTAAELIKVYPVIARALERGHGVRVLMSGQSKENFLMQYRDLGLPESCLASLMEDARDLEKASSALRWFARAVLIRKSKFRAKLLTGPGANFVVVHGDTLSSLVGSWLGWRGGLTVAHVEAGLRSPSLLNPFPEEITRRLVSRFSRVHFAPDARAEQNLITAEVTGEIVNTRGNTLLDAVLLGGNLPTFGQAGPPARPYALVNIHRFENLNSAARWKIILATVSAAADRTALIFVTHPQTRHKLSVDPVGRKLLERSNIQIRERMPFSEFIGLLKGAEYLISDGGSNQEECSYLGKPCLLLREATERQEGLDGCCVLSRFDRAVIDGFLRDPQHFKRRALDESQSPSARILQALET